MSVTSANESSFLFSLSGAGGSSLQLVAFHGHEALSQPYQFVVDLAASSEIGDGSRFLGADACLTLRSEGVVEDRHIHGIVAEFEEAGKTDQKVLYRATIVSFLHRLGLRHQTRIIQDKTTEDLITWVMKEAQIPTDRFTFHLTPNAYEKRNFTVQYRESDLAFIQRLMEDEGWLYYFTHTKDGHVMVISDTPSIHVTIPPASWVDKLSSAVLSSETSLQIRAGTGQTESEPVIHRFQMTYRTRPGKVAVRDFSYKVPEQAVESQSRSSRFDDLVIYDFPGQFTKPDLAARFARTRMQEQDAQRKEANADSNVVGICPGFTFMLANPPSSVSKNLFLITSVHHQGQQGGVLGAEGGGGFHYNNFFTALPDPMGYPFRPPRRTHKPFIPGVHTATVTGPEGEELYTDEDGRIKVCFHWDRPGDRDDKGERPEDRSAWVRVMQPWSGNSFGAVFVPRIGTEVVVQFLEGDPNRPVVIGSLYNRATPPPYGTTESNTKTAIRTRSTPGEEDEKGFNELLFEDEKGKELVYFHAEKNWQAQIKASAQEEIGGDWNIDVGESITITCGDGSIKMTKDGKIEISGSEIIVESSGKIESVASGEHIVDGAVVKLNC